MYALGIYSCCSVRTKITDGLSQFLTLKVQGKLLRAQIYKYTLRSYSKMNESLTMTSLGSRLGISVVQYNQLQTGSTGMRQVMKI